MTGLDFSAPAIEAAGLAADIDVEADFVCADVYDAPEALLGRSFDIVYVNIGAINWLPDIRRWAQIVGTLLRPRGVLYMKEVHPFSWVFADDDLTVENDYSRTATTTTRPAPIPTRMRGTVHNRTEEWQHPLGEVVRGDRGRAGDRAARRARPSGLSAVAVHGARRVRLPDARGRPAAAAHVLAAGAEAGSVVCEECPRATRSTRRRGASGEALVGREIEEIETPQPRHALDRWPERLGGRAVREVDARGKHLFIRFEGDLTLHSHLRMRGRWNVYRRGERWRRSPRRAWLVLRTGEHEVVQFDGPVLELMTDSAPASTSDRRPRPRSARAGVRRAPLPGRLREDDQTRGSVTPCSISATWRASGTCGRPRAASSPRVDPWRRLGRVSDEEVLAVVRGLRPLMRRSAAGGGRDDAPGLRARRPALPPLRHAHPLARPGGRQPHDLLVPLVPGVIRVGHKGADHVAPGNTVESFEAALEHGVDMIEFDVLRTRDGPTRARPRLRGRRGARCLTLDEGLEHFAGEAYAGWSWTST